MAVEWERIETRARVKDRRDSTGESVNTEPLYRLKVPGGWLVRIIGGHPYAGDAVTFYPDPTYRWKVR